MKRFNDWMSRFSDDQITAFIGWSCIPIAAIGIALEFMAEAGWFGW